MIIVFQRVQRASVTIAAEITASIGPGALLLLGVEREDTRADAEALVRKILDLRVFPGARPMDRSIQNLGGALLVVSQFTLAGRVDKGRRPSFEYAASPERAEPLYQHFIEHARSSGLVVEAGRFGADMQVSLVNDGPVTLLMRARDGTVRSL